MNNCTNGVVWAEAWCMNIVLSEGKWMLLIWSVWDVRKGWHEWIDRNEKVRKRFGIERELANRMNRRVLRWFGRMERVNEYRISRRVLMAEVSGRRERGRPRLGWMDGVKVTLGNRGMTTEELYARKIGRNLEPWCKRRWLSTTRVFLLVSFVLSGRRPGVWRLNTRRGVGYR